MGVALAPRRILIDGWNAIRTTPSAAAVERRDGNAAARKTFLARVAQAARREPGAEWTVVFDGSSDGHGEWERVGEVLVRYCAPRIADDVIVEMAADAVAAGAETVIVSNDREVETPGARRMWTADFDEAMLAGRTVFAWETPRGDTTKIRKGSPKVTAMIEHLIAAGHLPAAARNDAKLIEALRHALDYVTISVDAANKLARRLDGQLRTLTRVTPDPDPEKTVQRALKAFFEKR